MADSGKAGKFIQAARDRMEAKGTVGSLRKEAGAAKGKDIPDSKLSALKKKADSMKGPDGKLSAAGSALAKKVNFARNVRKS